jgi:hypothetical protein
MEFALLLKGPRSQPSRSEIKQARVWPTFQKAMAIYNAAERELVTMALLLNRGVCRLCREARARGEVTHERGMMAMLVGCLDLTGRTLSGCDRQGQTARGRGVTILNGDLNRLALKAQRLESELTQERADGRKPRAGSAGWRAPT